MKHSPRCPHCKRLYKRSSSQNARYWALLHEIAETLEVQKHHYSRDTWHHYFKSKFIGCTEYLLPNGKQVVVPISTTTLDVAEFDTYVTKVEAWAAGHGVFLEDLAA